MVQRPASGRALDVMVATPGGRLGQGGIDRIMAALQDELARQKHIPLRVRFIPTRGNGPIAFSVLHLLNFCLRMVLARMRGRLDLVHVNLASDGSTYRKLFICALARLLRVPYVLHLHGAEYMLFWSDEDTLLNRFVRSMFAHAGGIIVLGRPWRDFVERKVPLAKDTIAILPNATAVPALPHAGGGALVHILFLGRIGERKGVPQLCDALAGMAAIPSWRATIAGDGEVEWLRARLGELRLHARVAIPGWQGPQDVSRLLSEADILVLPSFAENLPMSVIEAMAEGIAVLATPVGAVEDIIEDGRTGLLVPPGDAGALEDALRRLVLEPDLRKLLGDAARDMHRQTLDLPPYAQRISGIWERVSRRQTMGDRS